MAAIMCWGLLKILCIMCVCICVCFIFVSGLTHTRFGPVRISPSTHTPEHSVSSSCVSVFTACSSSVWRGSSYRQSNDSFFPITLHQHSTTCIFDNKSMCLERGRDQSVREAHALYNCMTTCYKKLRTLELHSNMQKIHTT